MACNECMFSGKTIISSFCYVKSWSVFCDPEHAYLRETMLLIQPIHAEGPQQSYVVFLTGQRQQDILKTLYKVLSARAHTNLKCK